MFKIEVTLPSNSQTYGHYFMNKHSDDFLQFVPRHFTREYGEVITKDDIVAYKIDEASIDLLEGKLKQHEKNTLDCSDTGKIKVCRHDSEVLAEGWHTKEVVEARRDEREAIFSDSAAPVTVTLPTESTYDFGNGAEPAYELTAGHELLSEYDSLELELTGTALAAWPYDNSGKFLGNN